MQLFDQLICAQRVNDLIEVLDSSDQFIKAFRSGDASYLRRPLINFFRAEFRSVNLATINANG